MPARPDRMPNLCMRCFPDASVHRERVELDGLYLKEINMVLTLVLCRPCFCLPADRTFYEATSA